MRPGLEQLSRPMVTTLEMHTYKIEIVDFTLAPNIEYPVDFRNLRQIELHPIEWDGLIVLSNPKNKKERIEIPSGNIVDTQTISEAKGHVIKKEDLMIQITYMDGNNSNSNQYNVIIINLEDKYVNECLQLIESVRQNGRNDTYWTYRSLIVPINNQTKTIDIYPLSPFLAEGEDIIWNHMKTQGIIHQKVVWIEALTNYRVYYYNYEQHVGTALLLPGIDDIVVNNQRRTSNTETVAFYSGAYSRYAGSSSGTRNTKGTSVTLGDVVIIAGGKPFITFSQVADPHGLARVVKSIKQQTSMQIAGQPQTEPICEEQSKVVQLDNKAQAVQTKVIAPNSNEKNIVNNIVCNKCGNNNNPKGSKFCNKCGSKLQNSCTNCGHINQENSAFCNQCGFALS
jgi:double zinc ribbon protein